jgi:hypothetical protein
MSEGYLLSVVCPSLTCRIGMSEILKHLGEQAKARGKGPRCEVLALADNGALTIGAKMNVLNGLARGDWITCVADDDDVAPDYVDALMDTLLAGPDVDIVTFDIAWYWEGDRAPISGPKLQGDRTTTMFRPVAACRAELCKGFVYPDYKQGEDSAFRRRMDERRSTTRHLDRAIYMSHPRKNKPEFGGLMYAPKGVLL